MLLPGLGEAALPPMVRAAIALSLTALLFPVLLPLLPPAPAAPWHAFALIAAELIDGLWLGWLARLLVLSLAMGGEIISAMLGLSNVIVPNLAMGVESTALSQVLGVAAAALVLADGPLRRAGRRPCRSYRVIQAGTLLPAADGTRIVVRGCRFSFALSSRIGGTLRAGLDRLAGVARPRRAAGAAGADLLRRPCRGRSSAASRCSAGLAATLLALWLGAMQGAPGCCPDWAEPGAAMAEGEEGRTEAATPRRLLRAREEGSVALSRDLPSFASLAGAAGVLAMLAPALAASLATRLAALLAHAGTITLAAQAPPRSA